VSRLSETELRAWQALLHASHDVVERLDRELREEHDLSMASYDVLLRLARAPGRALRMTELADRVLLSPSGATRAVDRLAAQGLVERAEDPEDARAWRVVLTPKGFAHLKRASATHLRGVREHFTGKLSDAQLRAVAAGLEAAAGPHQPH
jgi:DNA-binding MarR family transcriptional regulator